MILSVVRAMRRSWVAVALVAGVLAVAVPAARAAEPQMPRTFIARDLQLSPGQPFSVALHPGVEPIEVRATPPDGIEVCQATMNGGAGGVEGQSWPSYTHFDGCRTPDAHGIVTLPSIVVPTYHVAFLVRGREAPVELRRLRITYVPGDGFFGFTAWASTRRRPATTFSVTPRVDHAIGIESMGAARARVAVVQHGDAVRLLETNHDKQSVNRRYGPVSLGRPVTVRVAAAGGSTPPVSWFVRWS